MTSIIQYLANNITTAKGYVESSNGLKTGGVEFIIHDVMGLIPAGNVFLTGLAFIANGLRVVQRKILAN